MLGAESFGIRIKREQSSLRLVCHGICGGALCPVTFWPVVTRPFYARPPITTETPSRTYEDRVFRGVSGEFSLLVQSLPHIRMSQPAKKLPNRGRAWIQGALDASRMVPIGLLSAYGGRYQKRRHSRTASLVWQTLPERGVLGCQLRPPG